MFVFDDRVERILFKMVGDDGGNKSNGDRQDRRYVMDDKVLRGLRELVEKEIAFMKLLRGSVLMGGSSKSNNNNDKSAS